MSTKRGATSIANVGEKRIIAEFIKPLFNRNDDPLGVGDDCAMVPFGDDFALLSTDRVPSDLTAFRMGILDHFGVGDYLARLNLSDIAACGGQAIGLLLNLGLPKSISYQQLKELCRGFSECAKRHGAKVLGGDITSACELSISATSIGRVPRKQVLTRRGAQPGDSIFITRPLGLTPTAFYVMGCKLRGLNQTEMRILRRQFTHTEPMLALGQRLSRSGRCTSCMDNTDGIGQSLKELADCSNCAMVVDKAAFTIHPVIKRVCEISRIGSEQILFNGGADFSLVGTLRGKWTSKKAAHMFDYPIEIVGHVENGAGVALVDCDRRKPLKFVGWNYFNKPSS